ncbi:hypothetical protein NP233_g1666 [Leucocoprinus birnbaumii]|uniref:alpha-glucosidase n=1 Tax=Leucocoprinus birnbaumii TaxID=56174 RepID=A0AAD5W5C8_9AGAR|nr:hypothetical protein NP233_g1666 [Leucocoprinus birnbaumii]
MFWHVILALLLWPQRAQTTPNTSGSQTQLTPALFEASGTIIDTTSPCPSYVLQNLREDTTGVTAQLVLIGKPCNNFTRDVPHLKLEVRYETESRLHVKISDADNLQYTIPESVFERPTSTPRFNSKAADLQFNYQPSPFAFWITRRNDPHAVPLFDTRPTSLPEAPTTAAVTNGNNVSLEDFNLKFKDQYLELTSALPLDTNVYGLGEVVASSGFRRAISTEGGTLQTMWARDIADPIDENIYGSHPVYLEHRFNQGSNTSQTHGVFLLSAAGSDILLVTPQGSNISLVQYRAIGGIFDFYFLSGPTPKRVIEQYGEVVGLPTWQPVWGFGFHLCRWGYQNLNETREQVIRMREADIPLEVMWNDIDLYHAVRDFTTDPVSYPGEGVRAFIKELAQNNQHYIPIVDAAIPKQVNATDVYTPYTEGSLRNVFITNPDGSEYVGQVWPGYTVFPDWFQEATQDWWTTAFRNWSQAGVEFSGIWLDMNEASSFCDGSCGTNANLSNTSPPFILPGDPGNPVQDYPEWILALRCFSTSEDWVQGINRELTSTPPPYAIHNGNGRLSIHALATNATHAEGQVELDVHNLWGLMEEKATHAALRHVLPGKRPFLISRSTFPSSGKWTGHWASNIPDFHETQTDYNLPLSWATTSVYGLISVLALRCGVLQFQLFQIPFVGADTCGFNGNTDEELCNRWMQLSAFHPFYRNHNIRGAIPQEPYRWASVANTSRASIKVRYTLLPYWYTLFANSSQYGTPPVRALFFEFPDEPELFTIDSQFLVGRDILVTPVLEPNVSTVNGLFPGRGNVIWRDWYTHQVVQTTPGQLTTLSAPLNHINVHIRDGSALLLHSTPAYTIEETRRGPYSLLISLSPNQQAFGTAYIDDGDSYPPGPNKTLTFISTEGQLRLLSRGTYHVAQRLQEITILGVSARPHSVTFGDKSLPQWIYQEALDKLVVVVNLDLNKEEVLQWS